MKFSPFPAMPAVNAADIHQTIARALSAAGLQTDSGPMRDVTNTIRNALASAGIPTEPARPRPDEAVIDTTAREVKASNSAAQPSARAPKVVRPAPRGQFVQHSFSGQAGSRAYKLYLPALASAAPMPLMVMLHGCTQSPDDFAAGTRMNQLAEEHGFIVVYPEQPASANPSKCWGWFNTQDQRRDRGEPSLIAGITREIMASQEVDPRRIFTAGLSAGAAMAVVMGETYPELYAGVGAHSGLPYAAAHDIPSAMAAMKSSRRPGAHTPAAGAAAGRKLAHAVPTIVFHGDRDHTVHSSNGLKVVEQAHAAHAARDAHPTKVTGLALSMEVQHGQAANGRGFSRTLHTNTAGTAVIESWVLHGAGHAWSGGDASGSYTDRAGPDASAEMVRFFLAQPPAGSA